MYLKLSEQVDYRPLHCDNYRNKGTWGSHVIVLWNLLPYTITRHFARHSKSQTYLGNVTGYPGVFQDNLHPYPSKPIPASTGVGFDKYRCGFFKNPRVYNPWMGTPQILTRRIHYHY